MKTNRLRVGNIIGSYNSTESFLIVEVIEFGACHLSGQDVPDDARDIFGIPLSEEWIMKLRFMPLDKSRWVHKKHKNVVILYKPGKWFLKILKITIEMTCIHELQNLCLDIADIDLSIKS